MIEDAVACREAGWPRRGFERLGDAGTRGMAKVSRFSISSCGSATQTSKAMSGPPCHTTVNQMLRSMVLLAYCVLVIRDLKNSTASENEPK